MPPPLWIASSFLAGALLSLLMPVALLIGLAIWHTRTIRSIPQDPPPPEVAPIHTNTAGDREPSAVTADTQATVDRGA